MAQLLKEQSQGAPYRGLPVEEKNDSSSITAISGETVQFYYSDAGVRTVDAGQAAGVAVEAVLARNNVKNKQGKTQATILDTSLTFTSTAFTTEVQINYDILEELDNVSWASRLSTLTAGLANGEYVVDYSKGILYGKKASTQTSLASGAYNVTSETISVTISGGAVSMTDDAAFTPGTSLVNPVGYFADETATDSVNEGDIGAPRMTLNRRPITSSETADDAAAETGTKVSLSGFVFDDAAPDSVDEGDAGYARMSANRNAYVTIRDAAGNERGQNVDADGAASTTIPAAKIALGAFVTPTAAQTTAYAASLVVKAAAGTLYQIFGYNSHSATVFVQVHNTTSLPADTSVPIITFAVPATSNFALDLGLMGRAFGTGITVASSSTGPTLTVSGSTAWINALYA